MNLLSLVLKRATRHWQLLATLGLGVILATALLASGPVLVNTVVEFSLRRAMSSGDILRGHVRLEAFTFIGGEEPQMAYEAEDAAVRSILNEQLGRYIAEVIPGATAWWQLPWLEGVLQTDQRLNLRAYGVEGALEERLTLIAGGWPQQPTGDERVVSGLVSEAMAEALQLAPGDRLPLSERASEQEPSAWLEVAGVVRPVDPQDLFWFGRFSPFIVEGEDNWSAQYSVLVPAGQFFTAAAAWLPTGRPSLQWNVLLDPAAITAENIPDLLNRLTLLQESLRAVESRPNVQSDISPLLQSFSSQVNATRAPILLLTAEIVLLALYYVVMVAALSARQHEREFAVLASRGLTRGQLLRIQLLEALLIAAVALISGPILGAGLVRALALAGPLADVGEAGWPLTVNSLAWLAAAAGALACIVGLMVPAGFAVGRSIIAHQQAVTRANKPAWWQRYYLDVFLLAAGLVLLWRLQIYGSIVGGSAARPRVDWLLLLGPLALLLGTGTILLRLFPPFLGLLARLAARGRGLPAALAAWQAARNPAHAARLVLLLTMAMALGVLSTGLNATLDRSERERAAYAAGGDMRLRSSRSLLLDDVNAAVPQAQGLASLWRGQGSLPLGRVFGAVEVVAVHPAEFAQVVQFRDDFAARPVPELLQSLEVTEHESQPVTPLPGQPAAIGLWIWTAPDTEQSVAVRFSYMGESDLDRIAVVAKLRTAQGQYLSIPLLPAETGGYPEDGWRYFNGPIAGLAAESFPLSLHSLWVQNRARQRTGSSSSQFQSFRFKLALDDLDVTDRETGQATVVESFDDLQRIWQSSQTNSPTRYDPLQARSGTAALTFEHQFGARDWLGFNLVRTASEAILPALVSQSFMAATGSTAGNQVALQLEGNRVPFQIVEALNYLPTVFESTNTGYLVVSLEPLLDRLNRNGATSYNANEVLLAGEQLREPAVVAAAGRVPNVNEVVSAEEIRTAIKADPMALGLRSVTFFGSALTITLSLVGFAAYFYMSARQREAIYGVLRSIGMSPRQLYLMLVFEQVVLIAFGLTLGTILGLVLNRITLPGLPITLGEQLPVPPFRPAEDWLAVGRIYLFLVLAFLLTLGGATALLWRQRLHRVLRIGEE